MYRGSARRRRRRPRRLASVPLAALRVNLTSRAAYFRGGGGRAARTTARKIATVRSARYARATLAKPGKLRTRFVTALASVRRRRPVRRRRRPTVRRTLVFWYARAAYGETITGSPSTIATASAVIATRSVRLARRMVARRLSPAVEVRRRPVRRVRPARRRSPASAAGFGMRPKVGIPISATTAAPGTSAPTRPTRPTSTLVSISIASRRRRPRQPRRRRSLA